jgi:hypothetical protein
MQMTFRSLSPYALGIVMALISGAAPTPLLAQTNLKYQEPSKAIVDLVDTLPTPYVEVSPMDSSGKKWMLIGYISGLPTIADLAQPELRLAGLPFNPKTNGPSRGRYLTRLGLQALPAGKEIPVAGLPRDAKIRFPTWAPDGRHFSFVNISDYAGDAGQRVLLPSASMLRARLQSAPSCVPGLQI